MATIRARGRDNKKSTERERESNLKLAIDLGKADLCGILERAVGLAPGLHRPHHHTAGVTARRPWKFAAASD